MNRPHKKLHVLVATPFGTAGKGGMDRLMDSIENELSKRSIDDLHVRFVASRGKGPIYLSPFYLLRFCLLMLAGKIGGRLDIVHVNLASAGSTVRKMIIARLADLLGVPVVLHLHAGKYPAYWESSPVWFRHRIAGMFSRASQIIVLGAVWARFVRDNIVGENGAVTVMPNGAPALACPTKIRAGSAHVIYLGKLNHEKGIPELLEAFAMLPPELNWRATLAGDGQLVETRERVHQLGLAARIALPGWIDDAGVRDLMADADILVLPSHIENLPLCIVEAMGSGVTVVATPVGAVEEIIRDGITGLIVPVGEVEPLQQAIELLIRDEDLREKLSKAALALHQEQLDMTPYTEKLIVVWKDAANKKSCGR